MRIVGGRWKGRTLAAVGAGDPRAHLRPTTDRTRESLFNILTQSDDDPTVGAHVLDLFAGTGALGLEALSRGAETATFVDISAKSLSLLRTNIAKLDAEEMARILRRDATKMPVNRDIPATLIFLDPPYGKGLGERAVASARQAGWVATGATIIWEDSAPPPMPESMEELDRRQYGDTHIAIFRES